MNTVIKVEGLSKRYRLGNVGSGTLKDDLVQFMARISGKLDPLEITAAMNDRTSFSDDKYVWSLRDINFEVQEGEVLGIIGKNGAGKSTLLKILSKVTAPTKGTLKTKGKISSLLEVGTGFHPELTGRENIYLNGAILGMRRSEISRKLDEIIDFAGIQRYIDTPVKRYSSGMYVRLAFAVAAHLESDIMIIDEVLAVGDAEFQKKCLSKMKDVSSNNGKTVLFVSHNIEAIERLCSKALLLQFGENIGFGDINTIVTQYVSNNLDLCSNSNFSDLTDKVLPFVLNEILIHDGQQNEKTTFRVDEEIGITLNFSVLKENQNFLFGISVLNEKEIDVFHSHDVGSEYYNSKWPVGDYETTIWIPSNLMAEGIFSIGLGALSHIPFEVFYHNKELLRIKIIDLILGNSARGLHNGGFPGLVRPKLNWKTKKIN
jgi:lipopolysaccharide transport system ATP-binding protein